MASRDEWPLLLRSGFGTIFDIGYGWDYQGQCLVADAINARTPREEDEAWKKVHEYAKSKRSDTPAC